MAEFVCNLIPDDPDVPYDSDDYSGECLRLYCKAPMAHVGYAEVCDEDFCSYGEPRETVE